MVAVLRTHGATRRVFPGRDDGLFFPFINFIVRLSNRPNTCMSWRRDACAGGVFRACIVLSACYKNFTIALFHYP